MVVPKPLEVSAMAVAVVRSSSANHVAESSETDPMLRGLRREKRGPFSNEAREQEWVSCFALLFHKARSLRSLAHPLAAFRIAQAW